MGVCLLLLTHPPLLIIGEYLIVGERHIIGV